MPAASITSASPSALPRRGAGSSHRWALVVALSAVLAMSGLLVPQLIALHYVFKPLTTVLILLMAWRSPTSVPAYRHAIIAGLGLSTLGDICLMLPVDAFVAGLASFLLAHLCYLFAFTRGCAPLARVLPFVIYTVLSGAMLAVLWPRLPTPLGAPVVVYVLALAAMAAQAAARRLHKGDRATLLAAVGTFCFVLSDSVLAFDRFHTPFAAATIVVLTLYWLAQFLIARSVSDTAPLDSDVQR